MKPLELAIRLYCALVESGHPDPVTPQTLWSWPTVQRAIQHDQDLLIDIGRLTESSREKVLRYAGEFSPLESLGEVYVFPDAASAKAFVNEVELAGEVAEFYGDTIVHAHATYMTEVQVAAENYGGVPYDRHHIGECADFLDTNLPWDMVNEGIAIGTIREALVRATRKQLRTLEEGVVIIETGDHTTKFQHRLENFWAPKDVMGYPAYVVEGLVRAGSLTESQASRLYEAGEQEKPAAVASGDQENPDRGGVADNQPDATGGSGAQSQTEPQQEPEKPTEFRPTEEEGAPDGEITMPDGTPIPQEILKGAFANFLGQLKTQVENGTENGEASTKADAETEEEAPGDTSGADTAAAAAQAPVQAPTPPEGTPGGQPQAKAAVPEGYRRVCALARALHEALVPWRGARGMPGGVQGLMTKLSGGVGKLDLALDQLAGQMADYQAGTASGADIKRAWVQVETMASVVADGAQRMERSASSWRKATKAGHFESVARPAHQLMEALREPYLLATLAESAGRRARLNEDDAELAFYKGVERVRQNLQPSGPMGDLRARYKRDLDNLVFLYQYHGTGMSRQLGQAIKDLISDLQSEGFARTAIRAAEALPALATLADTARTKANARYESAGRRARLNEDDAELAFYKGVERVRQNLQPSGPMGDLRARYKRDLDNLVFLYQYHGTGMSRQLGQAIKDLISDLQSEGFARTAIRAAEALPALATLADTARTKANARYESAPKPYIAGVLPRGLPHGSRPLQEGTPVRVVGTRGDRLVCETSGGVQVLARPCRVVELKEGYDLDAAMRDLKEGVPATMVAQRRLRAHLGEKLKSTAQVARRLVQEAGMTPDQVLAQASRADPAGATGSSGVIPDSWAWPDWTAERVLLEVPMTDATAREFKSRAGRPETPVRDFWRKLPKAVQVAIAKVWYAMPDYPKPPKPLGQRTWESRVNENLPSLKREISDGRPYRNKGVLDLLMARAEMKHSGTREAIDKFNDLWADTGSRAHEEYWSEARALGLEKPGTSSYESINEDAELTTRGVQPAATHGSFISRAGEPPRSADDSLTPSVTAQQWTGKATQHQEASNPANHEGGTGPTSAGGHDIDVLKQNDAVRKLSGIAEGLGGFYQGDQGQGQHTFLVPVEQGDLFAASVRSQQLEAYDAGVRGGYATYRVTNEVAGAVLKVAAGAAKTVAKAAAKKAEKKVHNKITGNKADEALDTLELTANVLVEQLDTGQEAEAEAAGKAFASAADEIKKLRQATFALTTDQLVRLTSILQALGNKPAAGKVEKVRQALAGLNDAAKKASDELQKAHDQAGVGGAEEEQAAQNGEMPPEAAPPAPEEVPVDGAPVDEIPAPAPEAVPAQESLKEAPDAVMQEAAAGLLRARWKSPRSGPFRQNQIVWVAPFEESQGEVWVAEDPESRRGVYAAREAVEVLERQDPKLAVMEAAILRVLASSIPEQIAEGETFSDMRPLIQGACYDLPLTGQDIVEVHRVASHMAPGRQTMSVSSLVLSELGMVDDPIVGRFAMSLQDGAPVVPAPLVMEVAKVLREQRDPAMWELADTLEESVRVNP